MQTLWPTVEEEEESLEVLAEAAVTRQTASKKRRRLRSSEKSADIAIDLSNQGIARMLSINRARFGIDHENSVLHVFFIPAGAKKRGRGETNFGEEYPYLGSSVKELAEHVANQGISDVCGLAALYPGAFWNAVHLIGKDLDTIQEELFH